MQTIGAQLAGRQPVAQIRRREVQVALWPVVLVLYATLMPREVRIAFGDYNLFADRIGLILVLPYVIRKLMEGAIRFVLPDVMILALGVWITVVMTYHYGLTLGLKRGGSFALDSTVGYYLARISFRSIADVRRILTLFAPGLFIAGLSLAIESTLARPIVQPFAEKMFGKLPYFVGGDLAGYREGQTEFRLGFMRAKGPFPHSILGGLYLASVIGIYSFSGIDRRSRLMGNLAGLFSFFSLSSAAILAVAVSYGLIGWELLQRAVKEISWRLLLTFGGVVLLVIQLASGGGLQGIVTRYLTLNPATAYYRQLIWTFGTESVAQHPWFGIGMETYVRPGWMQNDSVDAHWLLLAMRYGLPALIFSMVAIISALISLGQASITAKPREQRFYRGVAISLFVLTLMMFTVTMWGGPLNWFTLMLGGCVACAQRTQR